MSIYFQRLLCLLLLLPAWAGGQNAASKADPLNRSNPRAAVTAFLEACQRDNYAVAA